MATKREQELQKELEALRKENTKLKNKELTLKVSEKGAISVYGLRKFPITLYKDEMLKVLDMSEEIREFIENNENDLTTKN